MHADRRVDAVRNLWQLAPQGGEEVFAHAVEALEFVPSGASREFGDCRDRQCIVGCKLRVNDIPHREEFFRAGKVVQIGHRLTRKNRITGKTPLLRSLDFTVPISALDQPQHERAIIVARHRRNMIDDRQSPLLIGLHREAKSAPTRECPIGKQQVDNIQGKLKPVGFLGIDDEEQIMLLRSPGKFRDARQKLGEDAWSRQGLEAGMQRRKLDGDTRTLWQHARSRGFADRIDRVRIGVEIALRVIRSARAFAQHIEGIAVKPLVLSRKRAAKPLQWFDRGRNATP